MVLPPSENPSQDQSSRDQPSKGKDSTGSQRQVGETHPPTTHGQNLDKLTGQSQPQQPGELARIIAEHAAAENTVGGAILPREDEDTRTPEAPLDQEPVIDLPEDMSPEFRAIVTRIMQSYPELFEHILQYETDEEFGEALWRLTIQDQIDHPEMDASSEDVQVGSYGEWAPSFIRGLEALGYTMQEESQREESNIGPKILMLGAQTPGAATDVVSFTTPFHPTSITLTDIAPVALDLAQTQEPSIHTVQSDWNSRESTAQLPAFDVAVGNRIVDMLPIPGDTSPFQTARRNAREFAQILANLAPRMSEKGGMVLTLNMPDATGTETYRRQLYLLQSALIRQGLAYTNLHQEQVIEFNQKPPPEEMARVETYTEKDDAGYFRNMTRNSHGVMIVVRRLGEAVTELQREQEQQSF